MSTIPIIKLEVEHMKYAIQMMISKETAMLDESLKRAVEMHCTPENIDQIVLDTARQVINEAVKEEVRSFFKWSAPGRLAIKEAVEKHMNEWDETYRRSAE